MMGRKSSKKAVGDLMLFKYFQNDVVQNDVSALYQKYHESIATS